LAWFGKTKLKTQQKHTFTNQKKGTTTQTHNRFTALFRDHWGEPAPEENFGLYGARED